MNNCQGYVPSLTRLSVKVTFRLSPGRLGTRVTLESRIWELIFSSGGSDALQKES